MKRRIFALIVAVMMIATITTACGPAKSKDDLEKVTFRLNYIATGLHAPFYLALEKGYYKDVGLDVTIAEGTGSGTTAKLIGMGTELVGLSDAASVAAAITQSIPIEIICPIYKINGFALITLDENKINTPKDVEGKKVGIATGDGPSKLWQGVVKANNIDESKITYVTMGGEAKVGALVNGQVDAILAGADNDAIQVKEAGKNVKVLRFAAYGAPTVGLSLIASRDAIKNKPETLRKFIEATLKGWDEARKDPDGAIAIMAKYIPTLELKVARGGLDAAIASLYSDSSKTIADVSAAEWEKTIQLLRDYMSLDDSFPVDVFYTTAVMPKVLPPK